MDARITPLDRLAGLPANLNRWLQQHGVATCSQAYALVLQLATQDPRRKLPAGVSADDMLVLRDLLEKELPAATRARLEHSQQLQWSRQRPLGVLPPEKLAPVGGSDDHSGAEPDGIAKRGAGSPGDAKRGKLR